ncbi:hypothetical protein HDU98_004555, partial [Podochytrium sp. JEL0797]
MAPHLDTLLTSLETTMASGLACSDAEVAERVLSAAQVAGALRLVAADKAVRRSAGDERRIAALAAFAAANLGAAEALLLPSLQSQQEEAVPRFAPHVRFRNEAPKPLPKEPAPVIDERSELLMRRRPTTETASSTANPTAEDDDPELKHQQKLQEAFSEDLAKMAARLKANSLMFGDSLQKDKEILEDADSTLQQNVTSISSQSSKLTKILKATRGNCMLTVFVILLVLMEETIHTFGKVSVLARPSAEPPLADPLAAPAASHPDDESADEKQHDSADDEDSKDLMKGVPDDAEDLDFTHARIGDLSSLNLKRLKSLKTLGLRQNHITKIVGFEDMPELIELDLYDNRISTVQGLDTVPNLTSLDLSFNKIRAIQNVNHLTHLTDLYFAANKISAIQNLCDLTRLTNLELGANRIR